MYHTLEVFGGTIFRGGVGVIVVVVKVLSICCRHVGTGEAPFHISGKNFFGWPRALSPRTLL